MLPAMSARKRPAARAGTGKHREAFTVATFNVNSVRSRLEVLGDWLPRHRPDVLCLQETKVEDGQFPAAAFEKLGYRVACHGQKSYNGVALASRHELADVERGLPGGADRGQARLIRATVRGVRLVNTYVPQGRELGTEHFDYKLRWLAALRRLFQREYSPAEPVLWCGDMNVAPTELDLHDPKGSLDHVCFAPAVRQALARVADWGFQDLLRRHHPEAGMYSFYDYRVRDAIKRGLGWRVDLIMATAPLAARSTDAWIDLAPRLAARPSDHAPVLAEFRL